MLRRDPSLVGVESPALREVPAWRPAGAVDSFGRGFIDLLGLDGHGDIRIVEAKLAKSSDDMTLMQGIDYHVWAHAYRDALQRSCPPRTVPSSACILSSARWAATRSYSIRGSPTTPAAWTPLRFRSSFTPSGAGTPRPPPRGRRSIRSHSPTARSRL